MHDLADRIIDEIRRNRISTSEVSDCLDKAGVIPGVGPLNRGHHRVGRVFWTFARNESNWELHEQARRAPDHSIVLTEAVDCNERAVFGHLVAKYLLLYRQVAGLVVCGFLRDAPHLVKENWPIWLEGVTPAGCFNVEPTEPAPSEFIRQRQECFSGAIAVCDDSGVVVVPRDALDESFLDRLRDIEEQEDVWFDCIDRRKWDTFDTVCRKRYLEEPRG